jgi:ribA/ribD-fused uncharacterized protein
MIKQFKEEYDWLSNFYPVQLKVGRLTYPSVEHFYVGIKCKSFLDRDNIANGNYTAGEVKKLGRKLEIREDWDEVKLGVMKFGLSIKFNQEPFKSKLKQTGTQIIQEGNYWNDTFWGVCLKSGNGQNNLGKLLMEIRDQL